MDGIRACVLDACGTLFDVHAAVENAGIGGLGDLSGLPGLLGA